MSKHLLFLIVTLISGTSQAQDARWHNIPKPAIADIAESTLDFPCWYCFHMLSLGGGTYGSTSSILSLRVVSGPDDRAFPRALVTQIESECSVCQPTAFTASARGLTANTSVFGANIEVYGNGRGSVVELNMGVANGGYVFDVVPTRAPDGSPSRIDSVMKVEGFGFNPDVVRIGSYIEAKVNPQTAMFVIPSDQGPVTVMATSDGRMRETWQKDESGIWSRTIWIDGVPQ